ncbi:MAG: DNA repair protein RadA, partial [Chloroflexota bacterium]
MAKARTQYICSSCGNTQMKWMGKCPDCNEWNTMEEMVVRPAAKSRSTMPTNISGLPQKPMALPDIPTDDLPRLVLQMSELNRVLGGGIVPGSGVLVGGDPGIGKSTLLAQMASEVSER